MNGISSSQIMLGTGVLTASGNALLYNGVPISGQSSTPTSLDVYFRPTPATSTFAKGTYTSSIISAGAGTTNLSASSINSQGTPGGSAVSATRPAHTQFSATAGLYGFIPNANDYYTTWDFDAVWTIELTNAVTGTRVWCALSPNTVYNTDTPTQTIGFRYSAGTDTKWTFYKEDGSSTTGNSNVTVTGSMTYVMALSKRGTGVNFFINGTGVGSLTWNPSAAAMGVNCIGNILSGSTNHTIDFYGFLMMTQLQ